MRWLMTTLVALPALGLFVSMLMIAWSDDPRAAAMDFFLLGVYLMIAVPVVRHLWRPTAQWQSARREQWLLERKLQDQLRIDRPQQAEPKHGI